MAKGEGKAKGGGKDKSKSGKAKVKVPKKVAGVKVEKGFRKAGNKALKLASQPVVSEAVAAAMLAAAAALRDPPATKRAAGAAADAASEAGQEALRLSDTLRTMAIDIARRTLDAWEKADNRGGGKTDRGN
ncbi:MAG TPA: hypothetical protein VGB59_10415 [Allosphingosinicella sp.]|jgi:hypothetical protein